MDLKRRAMEGALVPSKRSKIDTVAVGNAQNAVIQKVINDLYKI